MALERAADAAAIVDFLRSTCPRDWVVLMSMSSLFLFSLSEHVESLARGVFAGREREREGACSSGVLSPARRIVGCCCGESGAGKLWGRPEAPVPPRARVGLGNALEGGPRRGSGWGGVSQDLTTTSKPDL